MLGGQVKTRELREARVKAENRSRGRQRLDTVAEIRASVHSQGSNSRGDCSEPLNLLRWSLENYEDF